MKSSALALVAIAAAASAQSLPSCADSCVNLTNVPGCASTDVACICKSTAWIDSLIPCVDSACDAADQEATLAFAQSICGGVGVTISVPSSSSSAAPVSSSSVASTSASATGAASTTTAASSTSSVAAKNITTTTTSAVAVVTAGANMVGAGSLVLGALGAVLAAAL